MISFRGFWVFIVIVTLSACATNKSNNYLNNLRDNLSQAALNWNTLNANADLSLENINSWIPESGIRGRYQIAKKYISIGFLQEVVGAKVFRKGPHGLEMDYNSNEFGYYNPDFLKKLHIRLENLFANVDFIESTQKLYNSELKYYLRSYYLSYPVAANNLEVISGYKKAMVDPSKGAYMDGLISGPSFYLQESFREFAENTNDAWYNTMEEYDAYELFTCPGFWIRRSIDGTESQFYELLVLTLKHYDPEFLSVQQEKP